MDYWRPISEPYSCDKTDHHARQKFVWHYGFNQQMESVLPVESFSDWLIEGRGGLLCLDCQADEPPPWFDHAVAYRDSYSKLTVITSQPYCRDYALMVEELFAWAAPRKLAISHYPPNVGWYRPNECPLILIYEDTPEKRKLFWGTPWLD
jgi:hypothetical protein